MESRKEESNIDITLLKIYLIGKVHSTKILVLPKYKKSYQITNFSNIALFKVITLNLKSYLLLS